MDDQERSMTDDRPAEAPDREALGDLLAHHAFSRVNDDGWTVCLCGHVAEGDDDDGSHARHQADAVLALLPTPPAPGDREGLRAEVEDAVIEGFAEGTSDDFDCVHNLAPISRRVLAALAARDTPGEGLRADLAYIAGKARSWARSVGATSEATRIDTIEVHLRAALAARDTDTADRALAAELAKAHERIASLEWLLSHSRVARDTDQGARAALAEVERLCDEALARHYGVRYGAPVVGVDAIRAVLARDTDHG
jgi:hypothetical protein